MSAAVLTDPTIAPCLRYLMVALAAIQGLYERLPEKEAQIQELGAELVEIRALLSRVETERSREQHIDANHSRLFERANPKFSRKGKLGNP